jgi:hypothetical protein
MLPELKLAAVNLILTLDVFVTSIKLEVVDVNPTAVVLAAPKEVSPMWS